MCDTLVALKESTQNGNIIFGKNSDRAVNEPQYFVSIPATEYGTKDTVRCTYIDIPQVKRTHAIILSKPSWVWGGEIGVNEFGVCIGNEAVYSNVVQKNPSLLGMDIVRIGLERGSTAKEAINMMTSVLEEFGQGGNCSFDAEYYYDNSYMVADKQEAWILETAGKYWAAKKLRKTSAISNFMCIGKPDLMHKQAETEEPFEFAKAFMDWDAPGNYNGMVRRNSSLLRLDEYESNITVENIVNVLRCHTTDNPWLKGNFSVCKHAVGPDAPHQTTNSLIVELMADDIILWGTGMSIPCISLFKPFWFETFSKRVVFDYDKQVQAIDSWIKRERINRAIINGRIDETIYKAELDEMQKQWFHLVNSVDKKDRQQFCYFVSEQEERFIQKWLDAAKAAVPFPKGDKTYQVFWTGKNNELGKNSTIAY